MPTLVITTSILLGRRVYYHLILWDHSKLIAQTFDLYLDMYTLGQLVDINNNEANQGIFLDI